MFELTVKRDLWRRTCAIAVMGKASIPGRAKTRLIPPLSAEQAARLNTSFLQDAVGNVVKAGQIAGIDAFVAYGPAGSEQFFRDHLPAETGLIDCSLPDFGACLFHAVTTLLARGYESAGVLNSDSPTLPTSYLSEAASALSAPGDRIVLGPSDDGGYYFLGVKAPHRRLFEEIDWSTSSVCRQTCDRAAELGLPIVWLAAWYDVDDASALARLHAELDRPLRPYEQALEAYAAPHTREALASR